MGEKLVIIQLTVISGPESENHENSLLSFSVLSNTEYVGRKRHDHKAVLTPKPLVQCLRRVFYYFQDM